MSLVVYIAFMTSPWYFLDCFVTSGGEKITDVFGFMLLF